MRKLEKRKLAIRVKFNNHFVWKYRKNLDVVERGDEELFRSTFINVTTGMQEIVKEFMKILHLSSGERVYSIQGAGISHTVLEKIDTKFLSFFHHAIKKQKIIIEGVISQSVFKIFNKMTLSQISSHLDRLTIVYILPDELIDFPLDIFIFRDHVLLVDYETERLVHIEDRSLIMTYKALLNIAEMFGKKIDLNLYLNKILKTKKDL
ncbi:MAG: hypothetical protein Q7R78_02060 [bacterium]|nr:hypothetical protein [bacterium]